MEAALERDMAKLNNEQPFTSTRTGQWAETAAGHAEPSKPPMPPDNARPSTQQ
jgi:hypothetical protein